MLAGELYLAADNQRVLTLTRAFNASDPADLQTRLAPLHELLASLGEVQFLTRPIREAEARRPSGRRPIHQCGGQGLAGRAG